MPWYVVVLFEWFAPVVVSIVDTHCTTQLLVRYFIIIEFFLLIPFGPTHNQQTPVSNDFSGFVGQFVV